MRTVKKRLLLSIAGGVGVQGLIYALAAILNSPILIMIFLLPGWAFGFAGRDSEQSWTGLIVGLIVMLAMNNLIYATLICYLLWCREVQEDIRVNDRDSFIKKPNDGSLSIK